MVFQYKQVVVIGATSGIGLGLAEKLVEEGSNVIVVGRRQDRLDSFVQKHGADRASSVQFDITDSSGQDAFVNGIIETYPMLDCVVLSSGVQSSARLSKPGEVNLDAFHQEVNVNFTSQVNLSVKFLAHLLKKNYPTSIVSVGTHLALVPAATMPAYSSSKAAMKVFFDCLRRQNQGSKVKFMEIAPPVVQTELHDYMGLDRGRAMGMPLKDFVTEAYDGLSRGEEEISVGNMAVVSAEMLTEFAKTRKTMFEKLSDVLMSHF